MSTTTHHIEAPQIDNSFKQEFVLKSHSNQLDQNIERLSNNPVEDSLDETERQLAADNEFNLVEFILAAREKGVDAGQAESMLMDKLDAKFAHEDMTLDEQNAYLDGIIDMVYKGAGHNDDTTLSSRLDPSSHVGVETYQTGESLAIEAGPSSDDDIVDAEIVDEDDQYITDEDREAGKRHLAQYLATRQSVDQRQVDVIDIPADAEPIVGARPTAPWKAPTSGIELAARYQTWKAMRRNARESMTPEQLKNRSRVRKIGATAVATVVGLGAAYTLHRLNWDVSDVVNGFDITPQGHEGSALTDAGVETLSGLPESDGGGVDASTFFSGTEGATEFSNKGVADMSKWLDGHKVARGETLWDLAEDYLKEKGVNNPNKFQIDSVKDQMLPELRKAGFADRKGWLAAGDIIKFR